MIILKSPAEIEIMARANRVVAEVLLKLKEMVKPGITTDDLDRVALKHIKSCGAIPTFVGYRGYPKSICVSVNDEIVHGIPGERVLKEGDIVGIDCGATVDGFVGDSAITVAVGRVSPEAQTLMQVTKECLERAILQVCDGKRLGDIGYAVQSHAESHGYSVVRDFVGHGIGRQMHEEPQVANYGQAGTGPRIKVGMVLAIEPMVNIGGFETRLLDDGWTVVTKDGSWSAHFEHSIACTADGPRVLSRI